MGAEAKALAKPKHAGGRPTKFNLQRADKIIQAVAAGLGNETACNLAGVSEAVLYVWLERGRTQKSGQFFQFLERYKEAQGNSIVPLIRSARRVAVGGLWRVPVYDENDEMVIDERTGKPKLQRVFIPPDGHLALKIAARRAPRDWGDKDLPPPQEERADWKPGEVISLFREAIELLAAAGVDPPKDIVLPPTDFKTVPNQPALEHANGVHRNGVGARNGKRDPDDADPPF